MADAKAAGLHVGVYFESQAISVEEAQQEAQTVIDNVAMIGIDYPVACRLGSVTNDTSRVDNVKRRTSRRSPMHFVPGSRKQV